MVPFLSLQSFSFFQHCITLEHFSTSFLYHLLLLIPFFSNLLLSILLSFLASSNSPFSSRSLSLFVSRFSVSNFFSQTTTYLTYHEMCFPMISFHSSLSDSESWRKRPPFPVKKETHTPYLVTSYSFQLNSFFPLLKITSLYLMWRGSDGEWGDRGCVNQSIIRQVMRENNYEVMS